MSKRKKKRPSRIGLQNESTIHAQLKKMYRRPGARTEAPVGKYVVDIDCGDGEIIEIQTRGFVKLRNKLRSLLETHRVRLVYPLTVEKEIVQRHPETGRILSRRRSPKRMRLADLSRELTGIAEILGRPGFTLEVILTREREFRCRDGRGSWRRRGTSILDRSLVESTGSVILREPVDYLRALLPKGAPPRFTNRDLAGYMNIPPRTAQEMTYCLRRLGVLETGSKKGNALVYNVVEYRFIPAQRREP